jgi:uncharacterized protein DUF4399
MKQSPALVTPLVVAAIAALTFLGCKSESAKTDTSAAVTPAATPAAATPMAGATIVSPKDGDTTGTDVTIVLAKEGPVTIAKASGTKTQGEGHYHLFLDTTVTAEGQVILPTTKHVIHIGTGDSTYTFKGLAPGQHAIVAVLGYGDHSVMAAKQATVHFVVKK